LGALCDGFQEKAPAMALGVSRRHYVFRKRGTRMSARGFSNGIGLSGALALAAILLVLPDASARAASFDCKRAKTEIEKEICGLPELSALDGKIAQLYGASLKILKEANPGQIVRLQKDQIAWLATRNDCYDMIHGDPAIWADVNMCLRDTMTARVTALQKIIAAKALSE
jgi:uncharacterized protein YecT (DUF1311 family)